MSIQHKVAIILAAVSVSALGLASSALAGEGGAAGSAAFTITGGNVTGVAVSAGIGKQDAFAGAFNSSTGDNTAFALGSAGTINVNSLTSMSVGSLATVEDPALATAQANTFAATSSVQIGTVSGDPVVVVKP
jgi:hypothetical protein